MRLCVRVTPNRIYWFFKTPSATIQLRHTDFQYVDARVVGISQYLSRVLKVSTKIWFASFFTHSTLILRQIQFIFADFFFLALIELLCSQYIHMEHCEFYLSNNTLDCGYTMFMADIIQLQSMFFFLMLHAHSHHNTLFTSHWYRWFVMQMIIPFVNSLKNDAIFLCGFPKIHKQNYAIYALLVRRFDFSKQYHLTVVFGGIEISRCSIFWLGAHVCVRSNGCTHTYTRDVCAVWHSLPVLSVRSVDRL